MDKKTRDFYKYFIVTCKSKFKFLEKDFLIKFHESIIGGETSVIYKNEKLAVTITLSESYGNILIDLIRLKTNVIPFQPTEINQSTNLDQFDFKDLLNIRNPTLEIEKPSLDDLVFNPGRENVVKRILSQYAEAVHIYAADVLAGDFSIFPKLESIVKERAKRFKATS